MTLRVLLFGGQGQLGQSLRACNPDRDIALHAPLRSDCNIVNPEDVRLAISAACPDVVVNAAAFTNVDGAERDAPGAFLTNANGAAVVAEICDQRQTPLIHISTDYVFDGRKLAPYLEDDPQSPINVYGKSKAEGDEAVRRLAKRHLIIRTGWVFGPYRSNFLSKIMLLARQRDELAVVDDEVGSPTASRDLASAVLAAANCVGAGDVPWGTYHFAGSTSASRYEFASEVVALQAGETGHRPKVRRIKRADYASPALRPADSRLDSSLFAATFGLKAQPWQQSCRALVPQMTSAFAASSHDE